MSRRTPIYAFIGIMLEVDMLSENLLVGPPLAEMQLSG